MSATSLLQLTEELLERLKVLYFIRYSILLTPLCTQQRKSIIWFLKSDAILFYTFLLLTHNARLSCRGVINDE